MRRSRRLLWVLFPLLLVSYTYAHLNGVAPGYSGAPGDQNCAAAGCHDSYPVNGGPGFVQISGDVSFPSWDSAFMDVRLVGTPGNVFGFQAKIFDVGSPDWFSVGIHDPVRTQAIPTDDSLDYCTHTPDGTLPLHPDSVPSWQFWTTTAWPGIADGPCPYLFVAAVSADGDGTPAGDYVYVDTLLYWTAVCACGNFWWQRGDVNESFDITSADVIALVGMVFQGEPMPSLCFLADVNCNLSVTSSDVIYLVNFVFKGGWAPCWDCLTADLMLDCPG